MKCLVLVIVLVHRINCMETIYMKRSELEDQATSASGYAYQLNSGGPLSYAVYPQVATGSLNHFGYPGIVGYGQEVPLQLPVQEYKPLQQINGLEGQGLYKHMLQGIGGLQGQVYGVQPHYHLQQFRPTPVAKLYTDISKFVKGGGSSYAGSNHNAHGEKGSTDYKAIEGYDKGAQGKHDNQGHKEHHNAEGGHKKGHHEAAGHYGKKEEAAKGSEGASFSQSSGHKKGSKTTGYHKVHHKDEYKKDHSFYDESDSKGHFDKHGDFHSHHANEKGGFEKGGHEDGGYQEGSKGVKGYKDEGKFVDEDSAYKGQQGQQAHHKDFQSYAKKGEQQEGKEHGFAKKEEAEKIL